MSDKYFTYKKLTEELYMSLPVGSLFVIANSSNVGIDIGEMSAMKSRQGDWDCWYADRVGEICHCFKDWDEFQKWEKDRLEEERRIEEEKRRKSIVPLDFA